MTPNFAGGNVWFHIMVVVILAAIFTVRAARVVHARLAEGSAHWSDSDPSGT